MSHEIITERIAVVREFNRFYTKEIGLLTQKFLKTRYPLTQARILFELAHNGNSTAKDLMQTLEIDPGYLSRILNTFEKEELVTRTVSEKDNRQRILNLTEKGKNEFSILDQRSGQDVQELLKKLSDEDQRKLISAMMTIENILNPTKKNVSSFFLRSHRPGDIGWMTYRHGVLYAEEYGWDETFEALVGDILVKFINKHDPTKERIWIAEQNEERVGCIMIVDAGDQVAKLRLFLVEPKARGRGLGGRLIQECIHFSRRCGYRKITLWTQSNLEAARYLYKKAGFELVEETPHRSFGHDLIAEVWEKML